MFVKKLLNYNLPDENGYFGEFGGAYVHDEFRPTLDNLNKAFEAFRIQ